MLAYFKLHQALNTYTTESAKHPFCITRPAVSMGSDVGHVEHVVA